MTKWAPAGELVLNNAGDIAYWDDDEGETAAPSSSTCICGHEEEEHGPSGACTVEGCLCACYETYDDSPIYQPVWTRPALPEGGA